MPWSSFASLMDVAIKHRVTGVIIANLTKKRDQIHEQEKIA